jgi:hypothetical protein
MPILDYGPILAPGGLYRAQIAVRAAMAWPSDTEARRQYVATLMSMHIAELEGKGADLPDPLVGKDWEESIAAIHEHEDWMSAVDQVGEWFAEAGGHSSVAMAPGFQAFQKDMDSRVGQWFAAGLILALIRRMATHHADLPGGASVNKAVFILERITLPMVPRNSHDLRKAWKTYKPVAHFCAALFDWFLIALENGGTSEEIAAILEEELNDNFLMFLAEAEAYLNFGLSYSPPRAKAQTLLDPDETWTLPEHRPWPPSPMKPAPFDDLLMRTAREYRAPIPGA